MADRDFRAELDALDSVQPEAVDTSTPSGRTIASARDWFRLDKQQEQQASIEDRRTAAAKPVLDTFAPPPAPSLPSNAFPELAGLRETPALTWPAAPTYILPSEDMERNKAAPQVRPSLTPLTPPLTTAVAPAAIPLVQESPMSSLMGEENFIEPPVPDTRHVSQPLGFMTPDAARAEVRQDVTNAEANIKLLQQEAEAFQKSPQPRSFTPGGELLNGPEDEQAYLKSLEQGIELQKQKAAHARMQLAASEAGKYGIGTSDLNAPIPVETPWRSKLEGAYAGFYGPWASVPRYAGMLSGWIDTSVIGHDDALPLSKKLLEAGNQIDAYVKEKFPSDPARQEEFGQKLANMAGFMATIYGAGALTAVENPTFWAKAGQLVTTGSLSAAPVALQHYDAAIEEMRRQNQPLLPGAMPTPEQQRVTERDAKIASLWGAGAGLTMLIPLGSVLATTAERTAGGIMAESMRGAGITGAQMASFNVMNNVIARQYYDQHRAWNQGMGDDLLMGVLLGAATHGFNAAAYGLSPAEIQAMREATPEFRRQRLMEKIGSLTPVQRENFFSSMRENIAPEQREALDAWIAARKEGAAATGMRPPVDPLTEPGFWAQFHADDAAGKVTPVKRADLERKLLTYVSGGEPEKGAAAPAGPRPSPEAGLPAGAPQTGEGESTAPGAESETAIAGMRKKGIAPIVSGRGGRRTGAPDVDAVLSDTDALLGQLDQRRATATAQAKADAEAAKAKKAAPVTAQPAATVTPTPAPPETPVSAALKEVLPEHVVEAVKDVLPPELSDALGLTSPEAPAAVPAPLQKAPASTAAPLAPWTPPAPNASWAEQIKSYQGAADKFPELDRDTAVAAVEQSARASFAAEKAGAPEAGELVRLADELAAHAQVSEAAGWKPVAAISAPEPRAPEVAGVAVREPVPATLPARVQETAISGTQPDLGTAAGTQAAATAGERGEHDDTGIKAAIAARDFGTLRSIVGNPKAVASRAVFESETGVTLPKTAPASKKAVDAWAASLPPETAAPVIAPPSPAIAPVPPRAAPLQPDAGAAEAIIASATTPGMAKTLASVKEGVDAKDVERLRKILPDTHNRQSRKVFETLTGVKLPKTAGGTLAAIDAWAGITPERRAEINVAHDRAVLAERDRAREAELGKILSKMLDSKTGETVKAVIDRFINEGYNRVVRPSQKMVSAYGVAEEVKGKQWWLLSAEGQGYNISKMKGAAKEIREYAQLVTRRQESERAFIAPSHEPVVAPSATTEVSDIQLAPVEAPASTADVEKLTAARDAERQKAEIASVLDRVGEGGEFAPEEYPRAARIVAAEIERQKSNIEALNAKYEELDRAKTGRRRSPEMVRFGRDISEARDSLSEMEDALAPLKEGADAYEESQKSQGHLFEQPTAPPAKQPDMEASGRALAVAGKAFDSLAAIESTINMPFGMVREWIKQAANGDLAENVARAIEDSARFRHTVETIIQRHGLTEESGGIGGAAMRALASLDRLAAILEGKETPADLEALAKMEAAQMLRDDLAGTKPIDEVIEKAEKTAEGKAAVETARKEGIVAEREGELARTPAAKETPKSFWTYQSKEATPKVADLPEGIFSGTQDQWETLSPGARREIARTAAKGIQTPLGEFKTLAGGGGYALTITPAPSGEPDKVEQFAGRVLDVAKDLSTPPLQDRVAIAQVYDAYGRDHPDAGSLASFKERLVQAAKQRHLGLSRLDMPERIDRDLRLRSEAQWGSDEVHFVLQRNSPHWIEPGRKTDVKPYANPLDKLMAEKATPVGDARTAAAIDEARDRGEPFPVRTVEDFASLISATRGTPEFEAVAVRLNDALNKAEMVQLANITGNGELKKLPKTATKKAALQSIRDRHEAALKGVQDSDTERESAGSRLREAARRDAEKDVSEIPRRIIEKRDATVTSPDAWAAGGGNAPVDRGSNAIEAAGGQGTAVPAGGEGTGGNPPRGARVRAQRSGAGSAANAGVRRPAPPLTDEQREAVRAQKQIAEQTRLDRSARNYVITDADAIGKGSPKAKVAANLEAIRALKAIQLEEREATEAEKQALVKYVGWGAFAQQMFDRYGPHRENWAAERKQLESLLSPEEYEAARTSTLNAHYTSAEVINGMWDVLDHMGFKGGRVLEPSAGVGHFIGLTPEKVRTSTSWMGVELDKITGGILKALYGGANVRAGQGFETVTGLDNFFDLAISNVPFGSYKLRDVNYKTPMLIHDYFFVKSLDKVRPGGVVAFVTSSGTLDKANDAARNEIASRATFLGAIRLPGGSKGAFASNAGTDVTTDIIFLRKRLTGEPEGDKSWLKLREVQTPEGPATINGYFADNPEMMLGEMRLTGSMYGKDEPVLIGDSTNLRARIAEAGARLLKDAIIPREQSRAPVRTEIDAATDGIKEGAFYAKGKKLFRKINGVGVEQLLPPKDDKRVRAMMGMRDTVNALFQKQASGETEGRADLRQKLNGAYDVFVKEHGPINKVEIKTAKNGRVSRKRPNYALFEDDADAEKVFNIEHYDEKTGKVAKRAIFSRDILAEKTTPEITGPADALAVVLNEKGFADMADIASRFGMTEDEAAHALGDAVYLDPNGDRWQIASQYLSGDVVTKLNAARAAAETNQDYARNIAALEAVQPVPLVREEIAVPAGAPWIPPEIVTQFLREHMGAYGKLEASINPITGKWALIGDRKAFPSSAEQTYGTGYVSPGEVFLAAFNGTQLTVSTTDADGNRVVLPDETEMARSRVEALREAFMGPEGSADGWIWQDEARAQRMEVLYNQTHNRIVNADYDGSHLTFPGMVTAVPTPDGLTKPFVLRSHQKNAIWRIVQNGNTLLAHVVGSGKTFSLIAAAMEQKRLGLIQRPMFVVRNNMLAQFAADFRLIYPNANLLVTQKEDVSPSKRKEFAARAASHDWDAIIITQSSFGRMPMSIKAYQEHAQAELEQVRAVYDMAAAEEGKGSKTVKELEKLLNAAKTRVQERMSTEKKDDGTEFEALGVDQLLVDEAQDFKNLGLSGTRFTRIKGIKVDGSKRAEDLYMKVRHLEKVNPGRSTIFATGTPISNTLGEVYVLQRYLQLEALKAAGIDTFDKWASTFGRITTRALPDALGSGKVRSETSMSNFYNLPELVHQFAQVADFQTADMLKLPRPELQGGKVEVVQANMSPAERSFMSSLITRAETIRSTRVDPKDDNMLKVNSEGMKAAVDMRLLDPDAPFNPEGKIAKLVENVAAIHRDGGEPALAQLIFLGMGVPKPAKKAVETKAKAGAEETEGEAPEETVAGDDTKDMLYASDFNLYGDLIGRLVEAGVPREQIATIYDAKTPEAKARLEEQVRNGEIRVLMGTPEKMGVGLNVQTRLKAIHRVDPPWKPSDLEQMAGRVLRQGNLNSEVRILDYASRGSIDAWRWDKLDKKARWLDDFYRSAGTRSGISRSTEDITEALPQAAEMRAAATDDPRMIELITLDREVKMMALAKAAHDRSVRGAKSAITETQNEIKRKAEFQGRTDADAAKVTDTSGDNFEMEVAGKKFTDRKKAGEHMLGMLRGNREIQNQYGGGTIAVPAGAVGGLNAVIEAKGMYTTDGRITIMKPVVEGEARYENSQNGFAYRLTPDTDPTSIVRAFERLLKGVPEIAARTAADIARLGKDLPRLEKQAAKGAFPKAAELAKAEERIKFIMDAMKAESEERYALPEDHAVESVPLRTNAQTMVLMLPFKEKWGDPRFNPEDKARALSRLMDIHKMDVSAAPWSDIVNAVLDIEQITSQLYFYGEKVDLDAARSIVYGDVWRYAIDRYRTKEQIRTRGHESIFNSDVVSDEIKDIVHYGREAIDHLLFYRRKGIVYLLESMDKEEQKTNIGVPLEKIGETQSSGFYFQAGRRLADVPDAIFQMGGQAVIDHLRQAGVKRAEIEHFGLDDLAQEKPVTREAFERAIAIRMFDFRRKMSWLNPERSQKDYELGGTRAFRGPRIPGRGIYFEELMAFPKKLKGGEPLAAGHFESPHWNDVLKGTWASWRGSVRDIPEWGKMLIGEEGQTDYMRGVLSGRRPKMSKKDYLAFIKERPKFEDTMTYANKFINSIFTHINIHDFDSKLSYKNRLIPVSGFSGDKEEWLKARADLELFIHNESRSGEQGIKNAMEELTRLDKLRRENQKFFEADSADKYARTEKKFTPESPLDKSYVRTMLRSLILRAAKEKADSISIATSDTTQRIQNNKDAAHFYDEQLKPALEKELRRISGDSSMSLEKVKLPKALGAWKTEKPYTVWAARLTPEMVAKVREQGQPMFALPPEAAGLPPVLQEAMPQIAREVEDYLRQMLPRDVAIRVLDRLLTSSGEEVAGVSSAMNKLIRVALKHGPSRALDPVRAREIGQHEVTHMLLDLGLLTPEEETLLLDRARKVDIQIDEAAYRAIYQRKAEDLGLTGAEAEAFVNRRIDRELIAHLAETFERGEAQYGSRIDSILARFREFMAAILRAIRSATGFRNWKDVESDILSGRVAARGEQNAGIGETGAPRGAEIEQPSGRLTAGAPGRGWPGEASGLALAMGGQPRGAGQPAPSRGFRIGDGYAGVVTDHPASLNGLRSRTYRLYPIGNPAELNNPLGPRAHTKEISNGVWQVISADLRSGDADLGRQGLGQKLYDAIEADTGGDVVPSKILMPQGHRFWQKRDARAVQDFRQLPFETNGEWHSPEGLRDQLTVLEHDLAHETSAERLRELMSERDTLREVLSSIPPARVDPTEAFALAPVPPEPKTIKPLREILANLKQALGMTVTQGVTRRFSVYGQDSGRRLNATSPGNAFRAQYDRNSGVARTKIASDIGGIAHEGGHHLERLFGEPLKNLAAKHVNELSPLARDLQGEPASEGFAEFFRRYLLNRQGGGDSARSVAPQFYDAFEKFLDARDPAMRDRFDEVAATVASEDYKRYMAGSALERGKADIVSAEDRQPRSWTQFLAAAGQDIYSGAWFTRAFNAGIDFSHPIYMGGQMLLKIADTNGIRDPEGRPISLPHHQNPYMLARLMPYAYKQGLDWVKNGMTNYRLADATWQVFKGGKLLQSFPGEQGVQAAAFAKQNGGRVKPGNGYRSPSIFEAVEHFAGTKDFNGDHKKTFDQYLLARRAVEEWGRWNTKQTTLIELQRQISALDEHLGGTIPFGGKQPHGGLHEGVRNLESMLIRRVNAIRTHEAILRRTEADLASRMADERKAVEEPQATTPERLSEGRAEQRRAMLREQINTLAERVDASRGLLQRLNAEHAGIEGRLEAERDLLQKVEAHARSLRGLYKRTKENGLQREPFRDGESEFRERIAQTEAQNPRARAAAQMVYDFQQQAALHDFQAGFITKETLDAYTEAKDYYVPAQRDMSDIASSLAFGGTSIKKHAPSKAFGGSWRDVESPLEAIIQRSYNRAIKTRFNEMTRGFADLAEAAGAGSGDICEPITREELVRNNPDGLEKIKQGFMEQGFSARDADAMVLGIAYDWGDTQYMLSRKPDSGPMQPLRLPYWRNGELNYLRLNDPEWGAKMYDAMNGLGEDMSNLVIDVMSAPAKLTSGLVWGNPGFAVRHAYRTFWAGFLMTGRVDSLRTWPIINQLYGAWHMAAHSPEAAMYPQSGGLTGGVNLASMPKTTRGMDRANLLELRDRGIFVEPLPLIGGLTVGGTVGALAMGPIGIPIGMMVGAGLHRESKKMLAGTTALTAAGAAVGGPIGAAAGLTAGLMAGGGTKHFLESGAHFANMMEEWTRMGVFPYAMENAFRNNPGLTPGEAAIDAAYVSNNIFDNSRHGSKMLSIIRIVSFMNAHIQHEISSAEQFFAKHARGYAFSSLGLAGAFTTGAAPGYAAAGLPGALAAGWGSMTAMAWGSQQSEILRMMLKPFWKHANGEKTSADEQRARGDSAKMMMNVFVYSAMAAVLAAYFKDDVEYAIIKAKTLATWQPFKVGDTWYKLPKPFQFGLPSTMFDAAWDAYFERDPRFLERVLEGAQENLLPSIIPNFVRTYGDVRANRDTFRDKPIVPEYQQRMNPQLQFGSHTSALAMQLSESVNSHPWLKSTVEASGRTLFQMNHFELSPRLIDYMLNSTLGYWGRDIQKASDTAAGKASRLSDFPFLGGILQNFQLDPYRQSEAVSDFFDQVSSARGKYARAAANYKAMQDNRLINMTPEEKLTSANTYLAGLPADEREYALVMSSISKSQKNDNPLHRLDQIHKAVSSVQNTLAAGTLQNTELKSETTPIKVGPDRAEDLSDLLTKYFASEAENTMVYLGHEQYAHRPELDAKGALAVIKAYDKQVGAELERRLEDKHVADWTDVKRDWPNTAKDLEREWQDSLKSNERFSRHGRIQQAPTFQRLIYDLSRQPEAAH